MQNKFYSLFYKVLVVAWLLPVYAYSQQRDLSNTLLVYILPDSLELPVGLKGNVPHTLATFRSQSLRATLDSIKPVSLGKAFTNWN